MRNFIITIDGKQYQVGVEEVGATSSPAPAQTVAPVAEAPKAQTAPKAQAPANGTKMTSPMPGMIKKLAVANGSKVEKGDVIVILEAMKMDNDLNAPCDGTVTFTVSEGSNVETGATLAVIA